jgi:hypothetical protein
MINDEVAKVPTFDWRTILLQLAFGSVAYYAFGILVVEVWPWLNC